MSSTVEEVRKSFENSPFIRHLGLEIVTFEEGNIVLKLSMREYLYNVNKTMHGGVHASLLDTVMGMHVRSIYKCRVNTVNLNIHYLAPVLEGGIYAKASILQGGYKIVTAEGIIEDEQNQLIAKATGTFKVVRDEL